MTAYYLLAMAVLTVAGFFVARTRAVSVAGGRPSVLHSLPQYHGLYASVLVLASMMALLALGEPLINWLAQAAALKGLPADVTGDAMRSQAVLRDIANVVSGSFSGADKPELAAAAEAYSHVKTIGSWGLLVAGLALGAGALMFGSSRVSRSFRARNAFERAVEIILMACAAIAILTTVGILFSLIGETYRFFFDPSIKGKPGVLDFLFGTDWNPQAAMRADQGNFSTAYGFVPLLTGTLLITMIALLVAGPLGLFSAIYLAEYASPKTRAIFKPVLEILAGIPTVVLGFFAALTVAPYIRGWGEYFGLDIASESALAAGLVMGMMIIPFISSLSDDVINAVPQSMRDGAYALGATKSEAIKQVVLPAALPGIVAAFMLAISRAIGETMIVVMAAGLAANLTFNPLEAVTTITVQIKTILVGDQEFDSAKTLAAFALGFVLFFITLALNFIALKVVRRYREQYE
ncbi:MAG: phosphate ABC transporter permease subunit PstC [Hyphomicrobiaceae bacterium]|nr:phosphate ABC transporter permease subunit PstC [Hyphomicrobiaceae bacterium]